MSLKKPMASRAFLCQQALRHLWSKDETKGKIVRSRVRLHQCLGRSHDGVAALKRDDLQALLSQYGVAACAGEADGEPRAVMHGQPTPQGWRT